MRVNQSCVHLKGKPSGKYKCIPTHFLHEQIKDFKTGAALKSTAEAISQVEDGTG